MRNGPFALSIALHGAVVIAAFAFAAHVHRSSSPPEDLLWLDLAPPPDPALARAALPPKALDLPAARPSPQPPSHDSRPAPVRAAVGKSGGGGAKSGGGGTGQGLGVLAGEGTGEGFEMNAEPGNGDGSGQGTGVAPAPEPESVPAPKPPPKPVPKVPVCEEALVKPKPIAKPRSIEYPDAARADGKEGRLLLELAVNEDGSVGRVEVITSVHPALDAAAVAAVKTWRFEPASKCGKAMSGTYRVARRFELGD